jgi:hypothetical protein
MLRQIRGHLSYANVISTTALIFAIGGGAVAAVGSIPGPGGVISACYAKRTVRCGSFRLEGSARVASDR